MFHALVKKVTAEIELVLENVKEEDVTELVQSILKARRIVVHGAGRVGLACKGFSMRLGHLGRSAYIVGDSTLPSVGRGDLVIVASSSGETQTVHDVALTGRKNGARVAAITAVPDSRIATLADLLIVLKAPTRLGPVQGVSSIQPMASLFEESLQVFFDVVVLLLMKKTSQSHDDLLSRHSNLE